ncbi:protein wntless homolog [Xyrichtys novacula]|uniref:Guanine nucleotide-binding protein subunit gamma n=2 Tax=Labridae TaxID=8247 RepID=A0AAV1FED8_XYRNO|nr:protein wntless homolog [Xyrichtys novacula]
MAGAIIENMSTKKLIIFGFFILLFQVLSIMVGAFIAPTPTSAIHYLATKCIDRHRTRSSQMPWGTNRCQQIHSFDAPLAKLLDANDIVFAVHIPLPDREMSPWFQYMLAFLQVDIAFKMINQIEDDVVITIDAGLAYRDHLKSKWTTKFHSVEQRPLRCTFEVPKTYENEGRFYQCDPIPFMELGSVAHKYFLINLRLPVNDTINVGIGDIKDIHVVGIHQNGGFTKVWISMRTVFSPWTFVATVWYWHRISLMARPPVLLEKVIFALGISMTFLNVPVEWLSLGFEWTWMLLFEDVRQGVFYSTLFCFWIIFCGEHLMVCKCQLFSNVHLKYFHSTYTILYTLQDQSQRNQFSTYWWQVGLVVFGSSILLIFDLSERGVHLTNPFYSVWASEVGNMGGKIKQLPTMPRARRLRYTGIIFRFKFLMLVTLACAAMTVIFFILNQVSDGHWRWGDYTLQVHSAFFTGVYSMWNLYVFSIIFLYAPSHKNRNKSGDFQQTDMLKTPASQETWLSCGEQGPTETYRMAGKIKGPTSEFFFIARLCGKRNSVVSERPGKHSCSRTAMSSKMQSSSSIALARRTVQQLRIEASIERIKVSKASSDLMRYCGEHAKYDPLLMGVPASENPFKDKKPCTVL